MPGMVAPPTPMPKAMRRASLIGLMAFAVRFRQQAAGLRA